MSKAIYIGVSNNVVRRNLPSGYTQVEYIESSGTQYIDTGFVPNQDTRVYAVCVMATTSSTSGLFGARVSSSSSAFQFVSNANYYRSDYAGEPYNMTNVSSYGTSKFYVDKNKNKIDINGEYAYTHTYSTFACPGSMYIFATNNNGTPYGYAATKLELMLVYDNGILVRDYIPCRNPQGEYGLYDAVGGVFYGNAGTGEFIAGQLYYDLPDGYTQVAYIESSGTQYIDTGIAAKSTLRIVVDIKPLEEVGYSLIGYYTSDAAAFRLFNHQGVAYLDYGNGNSARIYGGSFPANERSRIEVGNFYIKNAATNETIVSGSTQSAFTQTTNVFINGNQRFASAQWYGCLIYDNGTLIRNFVPCKNASNAVGLYDMVGKQFYSNAGTGTFTAGVALVTGSVARTVKKIYTGIDGIARKVKKGYIGVNGIARLFYAGDPFASYSGKYTVTDVTANGVPCKLYTLTTSGTLVLNDSVEYWMCGGGGNGAGASWRRAYSYPWNFHGWAGAGGGGAYFDAGIFKSGSYIVTVGAAKGATSVGTKTATAGTTPAGEQVYGGKGGNPGGGAGHCDWPEYVQQINAYADGAQTGTGISTIPFGLSALKAHCAGGGGGAAVMDAEDLGGDDFSGYIGYSGNTTSGSYCQGGSNGGDATGSCAGNTARNGGKGGVYGGGKGGAGTTYNVQGGNATFYGAGGGGGAYISWDSEGSGSSGGTGGAGYQGVVYLLIPA